MVKGVSRRIVVVHAPEQRLFEEAIFILRDDAMQKGFSSEDIVEQACGIASRYLRETRESNFQRIGRFFLCGGIGAGVCGLVWLLTGLL